MCNAQLDSLLTEFARVFSDDPGEIRGFEADVHLDDDVQPIFKKAYQVPFAIRDRIKSQLQTGIYKGLFTVQVGYSTRIQDVRRSGQIPGLKDSCSRVRDAQGWRPWRKKWMV